MPGRASVAATAVLVALALTGCGEAPSDDSATVRVVDGALAAHGPSRLAASAGALVPGMVGSSDAAIGGPVPGSPMTATIVEEHPNPDPPDPADPPPLSPSAPDGDRAGD